MPHFFIDGETLDEWKELSEEEGTEFDPEEYPRDENGDFSVYEPAEAKFEAQELQGVPRQVFEALIGLGATQIHCTYDGGGDEGFAHFQAATIDGQAVEKATLVAQLSSGPLAQLPEDERFSYSQPLSVEEKIAYLLDWLADDLATRLLGEGYGTGEYSLSGAFVADLQNGQISDQAQ